MPVPAYDRALVTPGVVHVGVGGFHRVAVDRLRDSLMEAARRQREDPDAFIANRDIFGDLASDQRFVTAYRSALSSLHQRGARATLEALADAGT